MANTFTIGNLDVLVVSDGFIKFPPTLYYRMSTAEQWEPHKRWLDHEGNLEFPMSCFLVRSGGRTVLIDTGLGAFELYQFKGGKLMGELAAAGVKPEDIDTVFITHLHIDHCGTIAIDDAGALRPAFPNATYSWTKTEHDHWLAAADHPGASFSIATLINSLADRYEPADGGSTIAEGISIMDTPGHTPGHAAVVLSSNGERGLVLGDAISCPVQLEEPEWRGLGDMDKALAAKSQEIVLREAEADSALVATAHFPGLTFGRVLRGEGKRYWQPLK